MQFVRQSPQNYSILCLRAYCLLYVVHLRFADSKSGFRKEVGVQVPPPAPLSLPGGHELDVGLAPESGGEKAMPHGSRTSQARQLDIELANAI